MKIIANCILNRNYILSRKSLKSCNVLKNCKVPGREIEVSYQAISSYQYLFITIKMSKFIHNFR